MLRIALHGYGRNSTVGNVSSVNRQLRIFIRTSVLPRAGHDIGSSGNRTVRRIG